MLPHRHARVERKPMLHGREVRLDEYAVVLHVSCVELLDVGLPVVARRRSSKGVRARAYGKACGLYGRKASAQNLDRVWKPLLEAFDVAYSPVLRGGGT